MNACTTCNVETRQNRGRNRGTHRDGRRENPSWYEHLYPPRIGRRVSSSGYSSEIEQLLQQHAQPVHGLSTDEKNGLVRSYVILQSNYSEMVEFVADGFNIDQMPVHQAKATEEDVKAQLAEAIRLTHNYLASLYSLNEHVKEMVNRKTDGHVSMQPYHFLSINQRRSDYSRKLTFLWGLRVDFQHGGFSSISHKRYHEDEENILFQQEISENGFVENTPLDDMDRYLQYTNANEREFPYLFISRFHNNELDHFYDDCLNWFNQI